MRSETPLINPLNLALAGDDAHESLIRSLLDRGKRYIWGNDEQALLGFLVEGSDGKTSRDRYEVFVKELVAERKEIYRLNNRSSECTNKIMHYANRLMGTARHYAFADPLVIEAVDFFVEFIENRELPMEPRKAARGMLEEVLGRVIPNLSKLSKVNVDPVHIYAEYAREIKKIKDKEVPKSKSPNKWVSSRALTARKKSLRLLYPRLSEKSLEEFKRLQPNEIAIRVLTKKYKGIGLGIRDRIYEGKRRSELTRQFQHFVVNKIMPLISESK